MTDHDYLWDPTAPPDPDISAIERALAPFRYQPRAEPVATAQARTRPWWRSRWAAAAATVLVAAGIGLIVRVSRPDPWSVLVDAEGSVANRVGAGGMVVTGVSPATLTVGTIGTIRIDPRSELAVLDTGRTQHRLALRQGGMDVRVWAPPRFFVVDVPGASAIDLGCIYRMDVDTTGVTTLEVQYGGVEIASAGRRVLVPEGTGITIRPTGAGVPWSLASSRAFREAADAIAFGQLDSAALDVVLAADDSRESITMWHLLAFADSASRARLVDRIVVLTGQPDVLSRDAVMALDSIALDAWRDVIGRKWALHRPWWQRLLVRLGVASPGVGSTGG